MPRTAAGFLLHEVMLGVATVGLASAAVLPLALGIARAVAEGRRWSEAAALAASVQAELELAYRSGAPACLPPAAGSRSGPGVRIDWATVPAGTQADLLLELSVITARGLATDTLVRRVSCR